MTFGGQVTSGCLLCLSLETSPITDSDTAKRTVFQRSYSVVASEYDKQHSPLPARVKAVPRRRVHSGDAGNQNALTDSQTRLREEGAGSICNDLMSRPFRGGVVAAAPPIPGALQVNLGSRLTEQRGEELPVARPGVCDPAS